MSHLGDLLSALVDDELAGADRDRVSAHLARCTQCRGDAAALRDLKQQLRSLAADPHSGAEAGDAMTRRLLAVSELAASAGPSGPVWQRRHRMVRASGRGGTSRPGQGGLAAPRPAGAGGPSRSRAPSRSGGLGRSGEMGRAQASHLPKLSRRQRRYLVVGAMSIMVGLSTAAFSVGGTDPGTGPGINPPVQLYSEEHAITTGEVPFTGSSARSVTPNALESPGPAQEP
jgi:anti-sigma factor RsiW